MAKRNQECSINGHWCKERVVIMYKELIGKYVVVVYRPEKSIVNLRTQGLLLANNNEELIIKSTGEILKNSTVVIREKDVVSIEKKNLKI